MKYTPQEWASEEAAHVEDIADFWLNVKDCVVRCKKRARVCVDNGFCELSPPADNVSDADGLGGGSG